jgi:hypothetical protein
MTRRFRKVWRLAKGATACEAALAAREPPRWRDVSAARRSGAVLIFDTWCARRSSCKRRALRMSLFTVCTTPLLRLKWWLASITRSYHARRPDSPVSARGVTVRPPPPESEPALFYLFVFPGPAWPGGVGATVQRARPGGGVAPAVTRAAQRGAGRTRVKTVGFAPAAVKGTQERSVLEPGFLVNSSQEVFAPQPTAAFLQRPAISFSRYTCVPSGTSGGGRY